MEYGAFFLSIFPSSGIAKVISEKLSGFRFNPCIRFGSEGYYFVKRSEEENGVEIIFSPNGLTNKTVHLLLEQGFKFQKGLIFAQDYSLPCPVFLVIEKDKKVVVAAESIESGKQYLQAYQEFWKSFFALQPRN